MFLNKIKPTLVFSCIVIAIFQMGLIMSEDDSMFKMNQKESQDSLYQTIVDNIVQRIQTAFKQNTKLKQSDIRLVLFLMSEISKKRAEIESEQTKSGIM
jgi:hypothetical protein